MKLKRNWLLPVAMSGVLALAVAAGGNVATATTAGDAAPIKVMTIAPAETNIIPFPNILAAAEVYGQWVNDRGGLAGHPLEVIVCDDKGDPNETAACARRAVDEGVVAVVGSFAYDASSAIPILEEAGIAWFAGCCPLSAPEFTSPISFPVGAVFADEHAGVWKMHEDGCENPAFVLLDIYADLLGPRILAAMSYYGYFDPDNAKILSVSAVPGDYSAEAAQAVDGTDCIYSSIGESNWGSWLPAMQSVGGNQRLYGIQGNFNGKVAEQFPELTEGGVVINTYPNLVSPVWDDFRAALEEYDAPDYDWNSLGGLGTWAAYEALNQVVSAMSGEVDAASFLAAVRSTTNLDLHGMLAPIDLSVEAGPVPGFPRILNLQMTFDTISGGVLSPVEGFVDFTDAVVGEA